jgi:hypothetical protein
MLLLIFFQLLLLVLKNCVSNWSKKLFLLVKCQKSVIKPYFEKHFEIGFFVKIDIELVMPLETLKIDIQTCIRWQKLPMGL